MLGRWAEDEHNQEKNKILIKKTKAHGAIAMATMTGNLESKVVTSLEKCIHPHKKEKIYFYSLTWGERRG